MARRRTRRPPPRRRGRAPLRPLLALALLLLGLLFAFRAPVPVKDAPPGEVFSLVESALPEGLEGIRRETVLSACSLVGRVGYFWGGKSSCLGWDPRWGVPAVVFSAGDDSTGTQVPFGLDCSGLVTWAAVNGAGSAQAVPDIGNGVKAQYGNCTLIDWSESRPGDLVFFPDLSHVGIVVGRGEDGGVWAVHCSKSLGGVVFTRDAVRTGFTQVGAPEFYPAYGTG